MYIVGKYQIYQRHDIVELTSKVGLNIKQTRNQSIKFTCSSFRNEYNIEPLMVFSSLFTVNANEFYFTYNMFYCAYHAAAKSPK